MLALQMRPCGPVVDPAAAERTLTEAAERALGAAWEPAFERARPALAPIVAASPYLAGLIREDPDRLGRLLCETPQAALERLLAGAADAGGGVEAVKPALRRLKRELHLLTALCDLGGVWTLDQVTGALSRLADAAVEAALAAAVQAEAEGGRMAPFEGGEAGPAPGLFVLALGKHGAFELNYSSDIDISVFYAPDRLPVRGKTEPERLALRLTQTLASVLQERTPEGYVFRVDLRLRPDPASTPAAVPVEAALDYYESVGQNWERAALIKARCCAGHRRAAADFLAALQPFVWRRHLDYAAIADIHSIKRQIHAFKVDERAAAPGADLKLGRGGIREVEFYVQTQQLILGGLAPALRSPRTLDALAALEARGQVSEGAAAELARAYAALRGWEHRVQMLEDEQTHTLPEDPAERARVAALAGEGDLGAFDAQVEAVLRQVNGRYAELFADDEDLSSPFGSLVFTGVENDPATLATLSRMGFTQPAAVSGQIRAWHHGRIAATRSERARELFTRLAPRLLEAAYATGAPDAAFARFADFFSRLHSGVQVQSLFLARPELFRLVVEVMAFAPELASVLARRPAALDALLHPGFFDPLAGDDAREALGAALGKTPGFEAAMDAARRVHREQAFRIGVQVMSGTADAVEAGAAFTALADACIEALAPAALAEAERLGGAFPGEVAVVALGKAGSREMTARSDLDLMAVYTPAASGALSSVRGWAAETFYGRFTQRLTAALSAPTAEGGLYEVDLQLRPSGSAGPVAVSLESLKAYYADGAETWEFLALTRARVIWASSPALGAEVSAVLVEALRRPRDPGLTARDVREMRALMARERPPFGVWDLKLAPGGLVDIEFAAQHLQLINADRGGPLAVNTGEALRLLLKGGWGDLEPLEGLEAAWTLQQNVGQVLALALPRGADPEAEPERLKAILARAGGAPDFPALRRRLVELRTQAHAALEAVLDSSGARSVACR